MVLNAATPTGRTSIFAISRPSASQPWRTPAPVIERIHCFGNLKEAAPKKHYTKGAGDDFHMGQANGGLGAELDLHGDLGFSGLKSLLFAFFGTDIGAPSVVEANKAWKSIFTLPISPKILFTIAHYDGIGRIQEIPTAMLTSLSLEGKADGLWTWHLKGHGDRLAYGGSALNTADDVNAAVEASNSFKDKYMSHDASPDSYVNDGAGNYYGQTRLALASSGAIDSTRELPWNDIKINLDLKASAIATQRRTKGYPAINDLPEIKIDISVPTEGANIDDQGGWAAQINAAFNEGGNLGNSIYGSPMTLPFDYKFYMQLVGPVVPTSANSVPFQTIIECPRMSARCANPTAASSGLEPVKLELIGMKALSAPTGIQGVQPIYFTYITDHTDTTPPAQLTAPTITSSGTEPDAGDVLVPGTSIENGKTVYIYAYRNTDGLTRFLGQGVVGAGTFSVAVPALVAGDILFAYCGIGETKSVVSAGAVVRA